MEKLTLKDIFRCIEIEDSYMCVIHIQDNEKYEEIDCFLANDAEKVCKYEYAEIATMNFDSGFIVARV